MNDLSETIIAKVEFDTNGGCWLWSAALSHNGYGQQKTLGRTSAAHRLAYESFRGPVPEGMQLDHRCRVRCCCNPDHLEVVTREENIARGNAPHILNARKTQCDRGHQFTPENTYINARGNRECRRCWAERRVRTGTPNALKTHCVRGHPLSGDNLKLEAGNRRRCRTCANDASRALRQRRS